MAWEGTLGFRRLWRDRVRPAAAVDALTGIYSLAGDETYRGGYLITEEPDSPVMVLAVPLPKNDRPGIPGTCPYRYRQRCCRLAGSISSAAPGRSHVRWSGSRQRLFLVSRAASGGICSVPSAPSATRLERGCAG
jgi:hypothetical protein